MHKKGAFKAPFLLAIAFANILQALDFGGAVGVAHDLALAFGIGGRNANARVVGRQAFLRTLAVFCTGCGKLVFFCFLFGFFCYFRFFFLLFQFAVFTADLQATGGACRRRSGRRGRCCRLRSFGNVFGVGGPRLGGCVCLRYGRADGLCARGLGAARAFEDAFVGHVAAGALVAEDAAAAFVCPAPLGMGGSSQQQACSDGEGRDAGKQFGYKFHISSLTRPGRIGCTSLANSLPKRC